eukprot:sb/3469897/
MFPPDYTICTHPKPRSPPHNPWFQHETSPPSLSELLNGKSKHFSYVQRQEGHVFWLFENVTSMSADDRTTISRFLQCSPLKIDAKHFTCMNRSRLFWGNIPELKRPIVPVANPVTLQECLETRCGRSARVEKINCVTSRKRTETAPAPVLMEGQTDGLWTTEYLTPTPFLVGESIWAGTALYGRRKHVKYKPIEAPGKELECPCYEAYSGTSGTIFPD